MGRNCDVHGRIRAEKPGKMKQNPNKAWPSLEVKNTSLEIRYLGSNPGSAPY